MRQRKIGLDVVRAVAILLVLAGHFLFQYAVRENAAGEVTDWVSPGLLFVFGALGVEIFFVLSGYLIGGILLGAIKGSGNVVTPGLIGNFWYRRWMRTIPNYLLFLAIYALIERPGFGVRRYAAYLLFAQNLRRPMPNFFIVSWSLSVEEWFYVMLPVLIYVLYRLMGRQVRGAFLGAVAVLLLAPLAVRLAIAPGRQWDAWARKVVVMRLDSIMWGVLIAALERYRGAVFARLTRWWVAAGGAAIAVLGSAYLMSRLLDGVSGDFIASRGDMLILPVMSVGCALVLPLASVAQWPRGALAWVAMRISLWSYSLYLCHVAVIRVIEGKFGNIALGLRGILALVATFVVAAAVYHGFEAPILRFRDRRSKRAEGAAVASMGVARD
jgi:peptidoglycan/LPS O-acetylase OafA/YrhL